MRYLTSKIRKTLKYRISLILLTLACCFGCFFSGSQNTPISAYNIPNIIEQQASEDDWALPSWVTKTTNSGLYAEATDIFHPEAYTVSMSWAEINPAENVFDWRRLEANLEAARKLNKRIWLRIFASDVKHTPDWVKNKYPDLKAMQYKNEGGAYLDIHDYKISKGKFYPIWHPGFEAEFKKLLTSFKQRRYIADPALAFMYAPGAWRWNEWEVIFVKEAKESGVNADLFWQWFRRHMNEYADAANGYTYKLVFTGQPQMERCENDSEWALKLNDAPKGRNRLVDYAISLGMSVRIGAQEYFNPYSNIPSWGAPAKTIGNLNYQVIDETHALHSDPNRIIGTENELVGWNNLPGTDKYYFMKMATLKSLQLRMNWINTTDLSYSLAPQVVEYARKTMGKTVENSPDAWVALRQWNDPTYLDDHLPEYSPEISNILGVNRSDYQQIDSFFKNAKFPYRNWERWISQREVAPDGYTQPTHQVYSQSQFIKWNGFSYEAIRTDHQNQSNYIYFNVDDRFLKNQRTDVELKVTYLDDNNATWEIEYDALDGNPYKKTSQVVNQNSGKWKTTTFRISDAAFGNRQNGNMDFRIYNGGSQDLIVRFVRVIKLQPV
jgi:hypothetical protein